ncbi:hypothetical protein SAMN05446589_9463 [Streptomyces sp. OV198]|jgi:hypothetical protein|uniref:hypothetical protein n=1 Tax=Streptomyces sp. OV198 TaxID=1882787 RepID=UPI000BC9CB17|nr:hypothetical protein [Streptomyces sp. OV198]SOF02328.1 hypothetical protein SAMN05446589_9463 [Streptomyces sp. OV198]
MSTLTSSTPGVSRGPRPRLRGLTWLIWRQNRTAFWIAAAAAVAVYAAVQHQHVAAAVSAHHLDACHGRETSAGRLRNLLGFERDHQFPLRQPLQAMLLMPFLFGLFLGGPQLAQELEWGTYPAPSPPSSLFALLEQVRPHLWPVRTASAQHTSEPPAPGSAWVLADGPLSKDGRRVSEVTDCYAQSGLPPVPDRARHHRSLGRVSSGLGLLAPAVDGDGGVPRARRGARRPVPVVDPPASFLITDRGPGAQAGRGASGPAFPNHRDHIGT